MNTWSQLIFAVIGLAQLCTAYKFLIYVPTMGHSHLQLLGTIGDLLHEKGHEFVMLMPVYDNDVNTNVSYNAKKLIRYEGRHQHYERWKNVQWKQGIQFNSDVPFLSVDNVKVMYGVYIGQCQDLLTDTKLIEELKAEKFDVGISEKYDLCDSALFHILGINKAIGVSATPILTMFRILGIPNTYSFIPNIFTRFTDQMTFTDRLKNSYIHYLLQEGNAKMTEIQHEQFKKIFGNEFPSPAEIFHNHTALVMVNTEELITIPRPFSSKVVFVGGVAIKKPKPVSEKFEKILSKSSKGVVLISFGSVCKTYMLRDDQKRAITNAIKHFPNYEFIFRHDKPEVDEDIFRNISNAHLVQWMPQSDLLFDKRVVGFVTHGGMNSINEGAFSGTPMVAIPIFADQAYNVAGVERQKIAVRLERQDFSEDSFIDALSKILGDGITESEYSKNARHIARMIASRPVSPAERVVSQIEMVAEFGALPHLHLAAAKTSFLEHFLLDIIIPVFGVGLVLMMVLGLVLKKIVQFVRSYLKTQQKLKDA